MFPRVGPGLPRVPLEHLFSIYGSRRHADDPDAGRGLTERDVAGSEPVALVSETTAKRLFGTGALAATSVNTRVSRRNASYSA